MITSVHTQTDHGLWTITYDLLFCLSSKGFHFICLAKMSETIHDLNEH